MSLLDSIFGLTGQVVVVTGAANGLGRVFAYALADAGADVAVIDIDADGVRKTAAHISALGHRAYPVIADVSDEDAIAAAFAEIERAMGRIDVLVNNAGIGEISRGMIHEYATADWRRMIEVNLNSVFYCSREALKRMVEQRCGKIINIASIYGLVGAGFVPGGGYAATKGAVVNLTREMALEYASQGIQINAVCPGFHRTGLGDFDDANFADAIASLTPARRIADAGELQGTIIYLASSASDFMCGSIIAVDGGYVAQ